MANYTTSKYNLLADGKLMIVKKVLIYFKPKSSVTSIPSISIYGRKYDGTQEVVASATDLRSGINANGVYTVDSLLIDRHEVTDIWIDIDNFENILRLIKIELIIDEVIDIPFRIKARGVGTPYFVQAISDNPTEIAGEVFVYFTYDGLVDAAISAFTGRSTEVEFVMKDSLDTTYVSVRYSFPNNRVFRLVKTNRSGVVSHVQVGFSTIVNWLFSFMRMTHDENKLYIARKEINGSRLDVVDPSTLTVTNLITDNDTLYRISDFKITLDSMYIWYNSGSDGSDVVKMKLDDLSTVLFIGSFNSNSICLDDYDIAWRASVDTDGKIAKYSEASGIISETLYSNSDMNYIRHVIIDRNNDLLCLQRDGSGNSKLFKVSIEDGQTLFTYDFDTIKYIYDIGIDKENNYYVDHVDGLTTAQYRFDASTGDFNTPYIVSTIANAYDNCDKFGYLLKKQLM